MVIREGCVMWQKFPISIYIYFVNAFHWNLEGFLH